MLFGVNLSLLGPYEANFLVAVEKFSRVYSFWIFFLFSDFWFFWGGLLGCVLGWDGVFKKFFGVYSYRLITQFCNVCFMTYCFFASWWSFCAPLCHFFFGGWGWEYKTFFFFGCIFIDLTTFDFYVSLYSHQFMQFEFVVVGWGWRWRWRVMAGLFGDNHIPCCKCGWCVGWLVTNEID